jgi:hypothetical protein
MAKRDSKAFFPFFFLFNTVCRRAIQYHKLSHYIERGTTTIFFSKFVDERKKEKIPTTNERILYFFFGGNVDTAKRKRL